MGFPYPMRAKLAERLERAQTVTTRRPTSASDDQAGRYGGPRARNFYFVGAKLEKYLQTETWCGYSGRGVLQPGSRRTIRPHEVSKACTWVALRWPKVG